MAPLPNALTRYGRRGKHEVIVAPNMMSNHIDMQDKYCGHSNDIHTIQSQYTMVAAVGRHHKRGGAAFGSATSFVVSFVIALNGVDIVAVNITLVLHDSKVLGLVFLDQKQVCPSRIGSSDNTRHFRGFQIQN